MKHFFSSLLLLVGLVAASSCSKDEETTAAPAPMAVSGSLTGAQEVPAVTTSATGTLSGTYDKTSKELKYSVAYAGLTPTIGHFHIGAPGVKGAVTLTFPFNNSTKDGFVSPITGTATLTEEQATALLNNSLYANLHTVANAGGEIRAAAIVK
jgi:hypothetical protein